MSNIIHKSLRKTALPRTGRTLDAVGGGSSTSYSGGSVSGGGGTVEANFDIIKGEGISVEKTNVNNLIYTISHYDTSEAVSFEKTDKKALAGINLDGFGHVAGYETCDILALDDLDKRYLLKQQNDIGYGFYTWEAGFMTKASIRSAEYNIGWEAENPTGWHVSETGVAWYASMNVRGPILSNNIIGSPYYVSGWTGFGSQWDMTKHRLETDFVSVRKELRVYALDVFRIYGTNGDLAVSTTNKVDRVEDLGNVWRCHIDDYDGEMYMNMRIDDVVKCQTWEKKSGRYYMAHVVDIGNTWFDLSKTLLEGETTPAKGDILIRWDNLTNLDRKGLLYLSASDSYAPYMDVRYGDWNATVGTIKVRNGRLDGINDPLFPELYGAQNNFGLYTTNFYGTGELILRSTGESVTRTFEVLKDRITMGFSEIREEMRVSESSVLVNPIFQEGTKNWEVTNVFNPWTISGGLLSASNRLLTNFISGAIVVTDSINDRSVLQVADTTVTQRNALFTDRAPGKYSLCFIYRSLLKYGTMEVGIPGSSLFIKLNLSENKEYQRTELIGDWNGTGDFIIKVSGGSVNITDISFTSDLLANAINKIEIKYDSLFEHTATKTELGHVRSELDEFGKEVRRDYATQSWTATKISTDVGTIVNGKLTNYSTTSQTSTMISNTVRDLNLGQYATTKWTSDTITSSVKNKADKGEWGSDLTQTANDLTATFTSQINGVKGITDAFYSFNSTRMRLNRRIEMGSGPNNAFSCKAGISPDTTGPAFWAGSTWENRENSVIRLGHDGAGWLAKKNILWDTAGNTTFRGQLESSGAGNRVIIDPSGVLKMLSGNYKIFHMGYNVDRQIYPQLNMERYTSGGINEDTSVLTPTTLYFRDRVNGTSFFIAKIGTKYTIRASWPSLGEVGTNEVYKDSSGYLKVK